MYQDTNGNFQFQENDKWYPETQSGYLPTIQEGKYLDMQLLGGEINLECDEIIEDWDDLDSFSMYGSDMRDLLHRASPIKSLELSMYDGSPPPNSPVSSMTDSEPDVLAYKDYVNGVLKLWRENTIQTAQTHQSLENGTLCAPDVDMHVPAGYEQPSPWNFNSHDAQSDHTVPADFSGNPVSSPSRLVDASTNTSPRASSPLNLDSPSRISFQNFRSFSPRILRTPSPISLNSSSPRFVRSPSPREMIQHGLADFSFDEYSSHVVYGDTSLNSSDHVVPDIDNQFHQLVEDSAEFPAYRPYMRQRILSSCHDHVVPEMIEE